MFYSGIGFIQAMVDFFVGLAELILGLRVVLRLFAANPEAAFVHWVYTTSDTLLIPFRNIFPVETISSSGFVLDLSALFAMLIYAVLGYAVISLLGLLPAQTPRRYRWERVNRR